VLEDEKAMDLRAAVVVDGECDAEAPVAKDPLMANAPKRLDPVSERVLRILRGCQLDVATIVGSVGNWG